MPEIDLYKMLNRFDPAQIPSIVYGNKSIEDNSPNDYPYTDTAAWELPSKIFSKTRYRNTAFVNQEESDTFIIDLPENQDAITQATLLKSEEDQVQELIFRIKWSRSIFYQESLANKLFTLFYDAKEEDPDCLGIAAESLRNFYNFLQLHPNIKCPTISLTPDYDIYASWRGEQNRVFSIHFLPDGDARFVIFKPNDRHPTRKIRISGVATTDILMETVTPYCVEGWISE
ncbi:MAG: hypothetical protein KKI12_00455 [Proteobacteria bacterium]|nr:hypothetical protein [Pseudomonadota bacterium]MBU4286628.1 hypothetical protein [Pseudomonadota bacterium]MBU4414063.1 hypothetical protein [Pseudomonadota bacterium]MCG2758273.1 hypothetical protein [Desulfobacteraceae bacterium]